MDLRANQLKRSVYKIEEIPVCIFSIANRDFLYIDCLNRCKYYR